MSWISVGRVIEMYCEGIERYGGLGAVPPSASECVKSCIGNAGLAEQYVTDEASLQPGLVFVGFLLFYLVKDHCFPDGNKRVGWLAAMEILADLGIAINASTEDAFNFVDEISCGNVENGRQVVQWLAQRVEAPEP